MLRRAAQVRLARVEMERALAEKDAQLHAALEDKVAAESQRASAEARLKILGGSLRRRTSAQRKPRLQVSRPGACRRLFSAGC